MTLNKVDGLKLFGGKNEWSGHSVLVMRIEMIIISYLKTFTRETLVANLLNYIWLNCTFPFCLMTENVFEENKWRSR